MYFVNNRKITRKVRRENKKITVIKQTDGLREVSKKFEISRAAPNFSKPSGR